MKDTVGNRFTVRIYSFRNTHVPIAQSVEQLPFKQTVEGSIPSGGTKYKNTTSYEVVFLYLVPPENSILLGVITQDEADILSKDEVSGRWRNLLAGSGITPIEMHPPLWFWSRNGFIYKL